MFAVMVGIGCLCSQIADDPLAAVQRRYPVHRLAVTSVSGTLVHYTVPMNAPPELRLAYKLLEVAEREVLVSEALQLLELDYVNNERKLEALRFAYAAYYLRSPNTQGPQFFGFMTMQFPDTAIKQAIADGLADGTTAVRAQAALLGLAQAQSYLRLVLEALAYPDRPMPAPPASAVASRARPAGPTAARQPGLAARSTPPRTRPSYTMPRPAVTPPPVVSSNAPAFAPSPYRPLATPLNVSRLGTSGRYR
jgi:hypothetical protein